MIRPPVPLLLLAWLVLCLAGTASAAPPPKAPAVETASTRAAQVARAAQARLAEGEPAGAAADLAVAYALRPDPTLLSQLARAEQLAGAPDLAAALGHDGTADRAAALLREHFAAGREHFAAGRYAEAAAHFRLAYALSRGSEGELGRKAAQFLFDIAQCHRRAGQALEARWLYQRFLEEDPSSPLRAEAQGYAAEMGLLWTAQHRPPPPPPPPLYKRGWLWAVVGVSAAAIGAGVALAVELGPRPPPLVYRWNVFFPALEVRR